MSKPVLPRLAAYHLSALSFERLPARSFRFSFALLLVHALGLFLVAQLMRAPMWIVGVTLFIFIAAQLRVQTRALFSPALLAPFWFVYLFVALRFIWLRALHGDIGGYFDYTLPDPRVLLQFEFFISAAFVYSLLIFASNVFNSRRRALTLTAVLAAGAILGWAVVAYAHQRTFGATGSDPFAYVQMAIDMATFGTPAHRFALFPLVAAQQISWYPVLHVGYRLPFNAQGDSITVWSPGGAFAYALAYRIAGENALYLVNPFFSWLGALVSGLLAWELARTTSVSIRILTALGVACLLATSNEIVNWAGVTMVDTQALVFTVLGFFAALRVFRTGRWIWAVAAGLFWGAAYFVRPTQLVIAIAFLPLFWFAPFSLRTRLRCLLLAAVTAFLVVLPDLWYHQTYLGSWLTPESQELALYALNAIPQTLGVIVQSVWIGAEFGWLLPFIILGIVLFTRREPISSGVLLAWLLVELAVHLPYAALRLRDLLPEFPILAFYAVYGIAVGIAALFGRRRAWLKLAAAALLFLALELGLVRIWNTLPRVIQAPRAQFGAMTSAQRASFDTIAQLTPHNAIVGASLNSGALDAYAHRSSFRPADWCTAGQCDGLSEFLALAQAQHYEIYLLQDNASLTVVLNALRGKYHLEPVATLDVPLFGEQQVTDAGVLWHLTR